MMNGAQRRQRLFLLTSCGGGGGSRSFLGPPPSSPCPQRWKERKGVTSSGDTVFKTIQEWFECSLLVKAPQMARLTPRKTPIS